MRPITLSRPGAGERLVLSLSQQDSILFSFYPTEGEFFQSGNDLVAQFPDGGSIAVQGFFVGGQAQVESITLSDGTGLRPSEFLERFAPEIGAATKPVSSSGVGEYMDDSGTVVEGVASRLSALEDSGEGGGNSAFDSVDVDVAILSLKTDDEGLIIRPDVLRLGPDFGHDGIVDGILNDSRWSDPETASQFKILSIDMANGHGDTLDVDSLIAGLSQQNGSAITTLVIAGDEADTLRLPSDAKCVQQEVLIEGMQESFDHYQCVVDSSTTVDLYVQMNIAANFA